MTKPKKPKRTVIEIKADRDKYVEGWRVGYNHALQDLLSLVPAEEHWVGGVVKRLKRF